MKLTIRAGQREDLPAVLALVQELAEYERAAQEVENTVERMAADAFGPQPVFGFLVAEKDGRIVGTAIYYTKYSTWKGRKLHLEDLIVTEQERGRNIGKALFEACLQLAKEGGYHSLTWQVLNWNEPAINFYKKYPVTFDDEWLDCSLKPE
ncbi:MAG TPA: GNAT family N-acetyltransferase [Flammeovirgaceae bacterium]|nr:GNAT family N-acetyltransferase [Flammeovirgaceae bacterium]